MGPEAILQSAESERPHRCPDCGVPYATQEDDEGCPVCLLRRAMQPEATVQDLPDEGRFDHYEIVRRDDGCFDELGRGAMGVTYRALDTVLGHAVALKVIDARIAGERGRAGTLPARSPRRGAASASEHRVSFLLRGAQKRRPMLLRHGTCRG